MIVQTGSAYRFDNRLTIDTANANPGWITGVCMLDPQDAESPALLTKMMETSNLSGLRFGPTAGCTPVFGHDGHQRLLEASARLGLVMSVLINVESAGDLSSFLERFPDTPVALEHCMGLRAGDDDVLRAIFDLSRFSNLYPKLTFIVGGSREPYPFRDLHPYVLRIVEAYGANRCQWGSAFPCELWAPKVTYSQSLRLFTEEIPLTDADRQAILADTPLQLWFPSDGVK